MGPPPEAPADTGSHARRCLIYHADDAPQTLADLGDISKVLAKQSGLVWLDIEQPTSSDLALLKDEFEIHPVAIEDASLWHERPKIEFFEHYVLVIAHAASIGADEALITHEIAILAGTNFVVTLRTSPAFPLEEVERRRASSVSVPRDSTGLLYIILDTIVDGYFPLTERYDERLVRLESRIFEADAFLERTEREIFQFKRALTLVRSIVAPMREIMLRLMHTDIAPLEPSLSLYFRDVHDHVLRALEQIDITRDLVNSTLDIHLATQSHRQNEVSKQLTIIATIFLPLTYITGFFGQNFAWMTNGIVSRDTFLFLGVGSQIVTLIILFAYFRHRRWF